MRRPGRPLTTLVAVVFTLGGCSPMFPNKNTPAHPLTEEETIAQVVDAAVEITRVGHLQDAAGTARFSSCKATNRPPYQGVVYMAFARPVGVTGDIALQQLTEAMLANGWDDGALPGHRHHGTALHKGDVTAVFTPASPPESRTLGISIYGECRNMTHKGGADDRDITDQLNQA